MQPVHISLIQLHEYDSSGQLQDTQENKLNHEQESSEEYYRTEYDIRKSNNKGRLIMQIILNTQPDSHETGCT